MPFPLHDHSVRNPTMTLASTMIPPYASRNNHFFASLFSG